LGKDLRFYQNLDALVFDGQFNLNELASRNDWGHCSPSLGCELAMREGIRNLVLTHHDPRRDDAGGREMLRDAQTYVDQNLSKYQDIWKGLNQAEGPNILSAYDGLELDLNKL
jgi:ribonuclease BN (tRNA processing enzyme)